MDISTSVVDAILAQLSGAAVIFVRAAGLNEPKWTDVRGTLLLEEQNLIGPLRVLRLWASQVPDFLSQEHASETAESANSVAELHLNSISQLTHFLDALLLVIYRDGQLSPQWNELQEREQAHSLLALSITLQCLLNVLSAGKALDKPVPVSMLRSLLSALLTGSRPHLLLGQSSGHPLSSLHEPQRQRIVSYATLLFYSVLLHCESSSTGFDPEALELIGSKLISESVVFSSIIYHCDQPTDGASSSGHCELHARLLLSKLAEIFANYHWTSKEVQTSGDCTNEERLRVTVQATGLVLLLHSIGLDGLYCVGSVDDDSPRTPRTVQPCLTFVLNHMTRYGQSDVTLNLLTRLFQHEYEVWSTSLLRLMETNPSASDLLESDSVSDSAFPFARLRGALHILSELVFPDNNSCQIARMNDEVLARQLWDCVCDFIVLLSIVSDWLDQLFPSRDEPIQRRSVNGSSCAVYPSRMSKKMPTLPLMSPLSVCQAVGLQHDCLRCMAGLISTFPQFSLRLASHSLPSSFSDVVSRLQLIQDKTAFQCILGATNRDPLNPLACEWAILIIKLLVKPESKHEAALEGARLLSDRLSNLQLAP